MTFTWPTPSIGTLVSLIVLILAVLLGFMALLPKEWVLLVAAVAALKL